MATRVIADYLEVLQTSGAAARVTMLSAEALLGGNPGAKGRVTMLSAEALFTYANTPGVGPLRYGIPTVFTSTTTTTAFSVTTHLQRGSGRGLLVMVAGRNSVSGAQTVAATWNSVSLTQVWAAVSPASTAQAIAWAGWLANADAGYQTLAITCSQNQTDLVAHVIEVWGYDPAGAIGASNATVAYSGNASATTSASVTTTAARSMIMGLGWVRYGSSTVPAVGNALTLAGYGNSGTSTTSDLSAALGWGFKDAVGSFSGSYTPAALDGSQGLALVEVKPDPSYWTPVLLAGSTALTLGASGSLSMATPIPRNLNIAALQLNVAATGNLLVGVRASSSGSQGGGSVGLWLSGTGYSFAQPGMLPMWFSYTPGAAAVPTNHLLNPTFTGAEVGDPGTTPTSWTRYAFGLGDEIVAVGTSNGEAYIDVRIHGTNEPSWAYPFMAEINAAAASGQTWRLEAKVALVGGSVAGVTPQLVINEGDSEGGYLDGTSANLSLTGTVQEFSVQRTFNNPAAALVFAGFQIAVPADAALDATLRFQAPRLVQVS